MSDFDPYHKWLGISETARPVSKYRLLSIDEFESDRDVISTGAERQTVFLRTLQAGEHAALVAELLNEVSQARVTLLNADQKAEYDEELRKQQTPEPEAEPTPVPIPVVQTPEPSPILVADSEPATQESAVSIGPAVKNPHSKVQKGVWKQPVVIGVSLVGVIGVLILFTSFMFSEDTKPAVINSAAPVTTFLPLATSPSIAESQPTSPEEFLPLQGTPLTTNAPIPAPELEPVPAFKLEKDVPIPEPELKPVPAVKLEKVVDLKPQRIRVKYKTGGVGLVEVLSLDGSSVRLRSLSTNQIFDLSLSTLDDESVNRILAVQGNTSTTPKVLSNDTIRVNYKSGGGSVVKVLSLNGQTVRLLSLSTDQIFELRLSSLDDQSVARILLIQQRSKN